MPTLSLAEIETLSHAALAGSGAEGLQLDQTVSAIVEAEADGLRTVGLGYLPTYCEHLRCGKVNGKAKPTHEQVAPSAIASDAKQGFSFGAFHEAMNDFHDLAHGQGVAALAIRNSTSAGVLGWFVERTAKAGLIGLCFANSSALMAPYGGKRRFFGTNPLAYSVPRGNGLPPLIADMATSQVAYVTVKDHAAKGKSIPLGWGVDKDGKPTTDPQDVLDGGAMAPAGGYKGFNQGLMVETMSALMSGATLGSAMSPFATDAGGPCNSGQFFIAIDPEGFSGALFADRFAQLAASIGAQDDARLPGTRRLELRENSAAAGTIEVDRELVKRVRDLTR